MKLSRTVFYALQATLQLAEEGSQAPVPCSRLATRGKMPERFLLQVLRNLVAHGILRSARGVDGGYALERPADAISLLELVEAIDGPLVPILPSGDGMPKECRSKLEESLSTVTTHTREELAEIKVADLLPDGVEPVIRSERFSGAGKRFI